MGCYPTASPKIQGRETPHGRRPTLRLVSTHDTHGSWTTAQIGDKMTTDGIAPPPGGGCRKMFENEPSTVCGDKNAVNTDMPI